jgi:hypothetical protein
MMVGIVGKSGIKAVKPPEVQKVGSEKDGPSKFEKKRAQFAKIQTNQDLPPEVTQISSEQKKLLESNLRKRLDRGNAQDVFKVDLRKARTKLDGLTQQVSSAPKSPALDAVRNRLNSVEAQYQESEKLLNGLNGSNTSPRDMLAIQMQMYKMTQNIEIMTKVVEQTTSGVKSVLQTQV